MKTYTRDEIKRIMIDRPGVEFKGINGIEVEYHFSETAVLYSRRSRDSKWGTAYCLTKNDTFTIPANNEKQVELPESVRNALESVGWGPVAREIETVVLTALWAETVKLMEARKV